MHQLAELVQVPLRSYVLRITFKDQIADDIVQETLLEMYKIFGQLKQADHFWPWLCKIALNKIRFYSRTESRHQQLLKDHMSQLANKSPQQEGVAAVIYDEFKQCIFQAMSHLSDRQKAVLSLRCYENMSYGQIAKIMDMSELGCRLLFVRARKKLQHQLFHLGYGQKSLLTALVLFGKWTAPSEAAAAQVSITPALLSGGTLATGISLVTGKAAMTAAVGGAVVVGVVTMANPPFESRTTEPASTTYTITSENIPSATKKHINEGYYFFPEGRQGPVLTRLIIHEADNTIQELQNDRGNYSYNVGQQVVTINNYHYWKPDLSVMSLPTDSTDLESFLAQVESRDPCPHEIKSNAFNLFIVASGKKEDQNDAFVVKNYEALLEERFQYNWPAQARIQDNRDALHQQGWCYFNIKGQLQGKAVAGNGRLPLIYQQVRETPAWLNLTIAGQLTFIDTPDGAVTLDVSQRPVSAYSAGTFSVGLNRPWEGLHVLDTLRRDAALSGISFETGLTPDQRIGIVNLLLSSGKIEYRIDMEKDWIQEIRFIDSTGKTTGEFFFEYFDPAAAKDDEFIIPRLPSGRSSRKTESGHWLSSLVWQ